MKFLSLSIPIKMLLVAQLGLLLATPALAQTLNDTVRRIERETGGRILSAETVPSGGHEIYRIKVLTPDGRVRVVQEPVPGGHHVAPRHREALRRDVSVTEPFERPERTESSHEPADNTPRERGFVPRRERLRESTTLPRERTRREHRDD